MNREQFGFFLKKLRTAKENGLDVDSVVKEHENENVYSQVINGITYICAFPGVDANYIEDEETI